MRSKWNRASSTLDFKQDELNQLIGSAFPNGSVVEWQQAEGGLANTNIRLIVSGQTHPILLRLFVRDPQQALKEWNINRIVRGAVPSPEFFYFAPTNPFTEHPYILMEWIDGVLMEDVILNLPVGEVKTLGKSVGAALVAIHNFRFEHAGFFDAQMNIAHRIDLGGAGLIAYAKHCLVDGVGGERLGSSLSKRVLEFLDSEAHLLDEWHGQPCLSHSDYGGSNILVKKHADGWKVAAVLDWEFAFSGTPFFDLGNLLRAPHGTVPGFENAVSEGYQSAGGQLPQRWRKMSLLTDLTAWMEFMTRANPGDNLIGDARRIISETIDGWPISE